MKEHYGLSHAQKIWLNGQDMPESFNVSKEKKRIISKVEQAWEIFVPVLRSKVVDQEFKDNLFANEKFDEFLDKLLETERSLPVIHEVNKTHIARQMILKGFSYFQTRYSTNELISKRVGEIWETVSAIDEMVDREKRDIEQANIIRMRKGLTTPPIIRRDDHYHALCKQCWAFSYDINNNVKDAIKNIRHDDNCYYKIHVDKYDDKERKHFNQQFIEVILPESKK